MDGRNVSGSPSKSKSTTTGVLITWKWSGNGSPAGGAVHAHWRSGAMVSMSMARVHVASETRSVGTPKGTQIPSGNAQ
jgi:hypothetical protein